VRPAHSSRAARSLSGAGTREILAEVAGTILRRRPDLSVELLRKRTAAMQAALQDAMVEDYEHLVRCRF
jgi:hypothetical protein